MVSSSFFSPEDGTVCTGQGMAYKTLWQKEESVRSLVSGAMRLHLPGCQGPCWLPMLASAFRGLGVCSHVVVLADEGSVWLHLELKTLRSGCDSYSDLAQVICSVLLPFLNNTLLKLPHLDPWVLWAFWKLRAKVWRSSAWVLPLPNHLYFRWQRCGPTWPGLRQTVQWPPLEHCVTVVGSVKVKASFCPCCYLHFL